MRNFCQPHYRGSERLNGQPMATQHIQSNIHGCGSHIPFLPTLSLCVPLGSGPLTLGLTSRPLFSGSWLWVAPSEGLSLFGWTHCTSTTPLATVVLTANYPGHMWGLDMYQDSFHVWRPRSNLKVRSPEPLWSLIAESLWCWCPCPDPTPAISSCTSLVSLLWLLRSQAWACEAPDC
jgi:hypothetical protein